MERVSANEGMRTSTLLSVKLVAARLSIGKTKAYELIASGELRAVRICSKILVRSEDLEAYIAGLEYIRPVTRAS